MSRVATTRSIPSFVVILLFYFILYLFLLYFLLLLIFLLLRLANTLRVKAYRMTTLSRLLLRSLRFALLLGVLLFKSVGLLMLHLQFFGFPVLTFEVRFVILVLWLLNIISIPSFGFINSACVFELSIVLTSPVFRYIYFKKQLS